MPTINISANAYTVAIIAMGIGAIAFLFATQSEATAQSFAALIVPLIGVGIAAVRSSKANADKLEQIAPIVAQAAIQSEAAVVAMADNTALTQQVAEDVGGVHKVVNHQRDIMELELSELRQASIATANEIAARSCAITVEQAGVRSVEVLASPALVTPEADQAKADDAAWPPTSMP
jgi:hypothetical protein